MMPRETPRAGLVMKIDEMPTEVAELADAFIEFLHKRHCGGDKRSMKLEWLGALANPAGLTSLEIEKKISEVA
jgi:hypothetical protein